MPKSGVIKYLVKTTFEIPLLFSVLKLQQNNKAEAALAVDPFLRGRFKTDGSILC